jgi:hypothetical protein
MTSPSSDPRGPLRPPPRRRPAGPPTRADYPTEGHPRLRAVVWAAALLCGGLTLILFFFAAIGVVNFTTAPHLAVIGIAMALFSLATMVSYSRSERRGNTRWHDRERRGF